MSTKLHILPNVGRGVLASYGNVTEHINEGRRSTDASKLTFSLQLVVSIVGAFLIMFSSFWIATSSLRSDVRDIVTRLESREKLDVERAKLEEERMQTLKESINVLTRQQQLQYYDIQQLKQDVAIMKAQGEKARVR